MLNRETRLGHIADTIPLELDVNHAAGFKESTEAEERVLMLPNHNRDLVKALYGWRQSYDELNSSGEFTRILRGVHTSYMDWSQILRTFTVGMHNAKLTKPPVGIQ